MKKTTPVTPEPTHGLSDAIASVSRFLLQLSLLPSFQDAELGLAEWLLLAALSQNGAMSNNQLSKKLGLATRRTGHIVDALKAQGLIQPASSDKDERKNLVGISEAGTARLRAVTEGLSGLFGAGQEKDLMGLQRAAARLGRLITPPRAANADAAVG